MRAPANALERGPRAFLDAGEIGGPAGAFLFLGLALDGDLVQRAPAPIHRYSPTRCRRLA